MLPTVMSLYNHVANKDDIVDGIVDMVVGEIEVPDVSRCFRQNLR
jgi:hypothetical protein